MIRRLRPTNRTLVGFTKFTFADGRPVTLFQVQFAWGKTLEDNLHV